MTENKVENVGFKQLRKVTERRYRLPANKHYVYASLERHQTECRHFTTTSDWWSNRTSDPCASLTAHFTDTVKHCALFIHVLIALERNQTTFLEFVLRIYAEWFFCFVLFFISFYICRVVSSKPLFLYFVTYIYIIWLKHSCVMVYGTFMFNFRQKINI